MKEPLDEQKIKEVIASLKTIENHFTAQNKQTSRLIIKDTIRELNQLTVSDKERKKISGIERLLGKILHWLMKLE